MPYKSDLLRKCDEVGCGKKSQQIVVTSGFVREYCRKHAGTALDEALALTCRTCGQAKPKPELNGDVK